jgi:hypothetical protein
MSDELKQYGLYKIIAGIVIFGIGIIVMMVVLVINAENDTSDSVGLTIGISLISMFVLFFIALRVIGNRQQVKLKSLVNKLKNETKDISPEEIAKQLKVNKSQVEQ